jgi:hypothetical protein
MTVRPPLRSSNKIWIKQKGLELGFPWSSLIEIEDGADAVLLLFDQQLARFPNRIFEIDGERDTLMRVARELSEKTPGRQQLSP